MRTYMALVMLVASFAAGAQEQSLATPKLLRAQDLPIEVEPEALQRQFLALQSMRLDSVEYSHLGSVKRIVGDTGLVLPVRATELKAGDTAGEVLQLLDELFLAKGTETLKVTRHEEAGYKQKPSTRGLRLSQEIRGIPVVNSFLGISYDGTTRAISKLVATFVPDRGLAHEAKVSAERAEQVVPEALAAMKDSASAQVEILEGTHLAYYHEPVDPTPPRLVWVVRAQLEAGKQWAYYVDAVSGALIDRVPLTASLTTKVYNANGAAWTIPNQVPSTSMTNSQINANSRALEAKNHVLNTDSKLKLRFPLPASSFPTETRQIINYGFGIGQAFHLPVGSHDYLLYSPPYSLPEFPTISATTPADITSHEYTHGIVIRQLPIIVDTYDFQWGALREAFADIGAATVHVASAGAPTSATWRMAEGFIVSSSNPVIRSMANPADAHTFIGPHADWYPLRRMTTDYAHYNSTILSHAYYLSVNGGRNAQWLKTYIPEIDVPALHLVPVTAESRAVNIFIGALDDDDVANDPTMFTVKQVAMAEANTLYGTAARTSIKTAFEAVGVGYQCSFEPGTVTPSIFDLQCNGRFSVNWPDIPGGDRYIVMVAPQLYGWSFGLTTVDGNDVTHCMTQVGQPSMLRMRACNNCGCGPWSQTQYLPYSPGPCP